MCVFRSQLHLGHKDPLVETDDIDNSAITQQKIANGAVTHNKVSNDAALSNGQLAQASTTVRGGVKIDGTTLYWENDVLKSLRGGVPEQYIKSADVDGTTLKLTNRDNSQVTYNPLQYHMLLPLNTLIYNKNLYLVCQKGLFDTLTDIYGDKWEIEMARYIRSHRMRGTASVLEYNRTRSGWIRPGRDHVCSRLTDGISFTFTYVENPIIGSCLSADFYRVGITGYDDINDFYSAWIAWNDDGGSQDCDNPFDSNMFHPCNLARQCAFAIYLYEKTNRVYRMERISDYAKFRVQKVLTRSLPTPQVKYLWARW